MSMATRRAGSGRSAVVACTLAALLAGSSCGSWIGPARTEEDFARKAGTTATAARSAIETALVAVDAASKHKGFSTYIAVVLSEAEKDATKVHVTFDSIQPPNATADQQRDQLDDLLNEAESTLSDLRIAARRGHLDDLASIAEPLADLSDRLEQYDQALPK